MKGNKKRLSFSAEYILLFLLLTSIVMQLSSCTLNHPKSSYTLRLGIEKFPSSLNPHKTASSEEQLISSCLSIPLVEKCENEDNIAWRYEAAQEITDVTSELTDELRIKWTITENSGRAFRITLNPLVQWEDGSSVTAEEYIASMEKLLSPNNLNPNAISFTEGKVAIKNGAAFRNSGKPKLAPVVPPYDDASQADYSFDINSKTAFFPLYASMTLTDITVKDFFSRGMVSKALYEKLVDSADDYGLIPYTQTTKQNIENMVKEISAALGLSFEDELLKESLVKIEGKEKTLPFTDVGLFLENEHSFLYITEKKAELNDIFSCFETVWLTREGDFTDDDKKDPIIAFSFGPYRIDKHTDREIVLGRNPYWNGNSTAEENRHYQADRIVFTIISYENSITEYLNGKLDMIRLRDADAKAFCKSGFVAYDKDHSIFISPRLIMDPEDPVRSSSFLMNDSEWASYLLSHGGLNAIAMITENNPNS